MLFGLKRMVAKALAIRYDGNRKDESGFHGQADGNFKSGAKTIPDGRPAIYDAGSFDRFAYGQKDHL